MQHKTIHKNIYIYLLICLFVLLFISRYQFENNCAYSVASQWLSTPEQSSFRFGFCRFNLEHGV